MNNNVTIILGAQGSGKTTIMNKLIACDNAIEYNAFNGLKDLCLNISAGNYKYVIWEGALVNDLPAVKELITSEIVNVRMPYSRNIIPVTLPHVIITSFELTAHHFAGRRGITLIQIL